MTEKKRLYRSESDRLLGGVCGGIAEVYNMDPALIRLATAALVLTGVSPLIYLLAWLVIPTESEVKETGTETKKVKDEDQEEEGDEKEESKDEDEKEE